MLHEADVGWPRTQVVRSNMFGKHVKSSGLSSESDEEEPQRSASVEDSEVSVTASPDRVLRPSFGPSRHFPFDSREL